MDQVAAKMLAWEAGSRWYALFPVLGEPLKDRLFELRGKGFTRLYQDGRIYEFSTPESLLEIDFSRPLWVLADRLITGPDQRQRVVDTIETCYAQAGEVVFERAGASGERVRFSEKFSCKTCLIPFDDPEPRLFSFNSPFGACPRCQGFGNTIDYDFELMVPEKALTIDGGAIKPWRSSEYRNWLGRLKQTGAVRFNTPFCELSQAERDFVWQGDGEFPGLRGFFSELERKKYKLHVRMKLSRYRGYAQCPDCRGARLRKEALYIRIAGRTIHDVVKMNIGESVAFFDSLELAAEEAAIAGKVLVEIRQRLKFLNDVGLEYLTLDRLSATLSGGEAQRIQLATCLGSRLVGACYVLDEPSSDCTRGTRRGSSAFCTSCATWATRSWWWSTIRK